MIELAHSKDYNAEHDALTPKERFDIDQIENMIRYEQVPKTVHPHKLENTKIDLWSYCANNQGIRVIVFKWKPKEWILATCGHHEPVYKKAMRMRSEPVPGERLPRIVVDVVKSYTSLPIIEPPIEQPTLPRKDPGFVNINESDFAELGVPVDFIHRLMGVSTSEMLLEILEGLDSLSQDVKDRLIVLYSYPERLAEIKAEIHVLEERPALETALKESPTASEQFVILSEETRTKFYNGKLENWQVFLHPSQKRAVEMEANGPAMVTGPAGTGKTVVAVHRLNWLLNHPKVFPVNQKVLFLTYTTTLAEVSKSLLTTICTSGLDRVHVTWLDDFIRTLWHSVSHGKGISHNDDPPKEVKSVISKSYSGKRDYKFLYTELLEVVLENRISSVEEYVAFQRPASRPRVLREERPELWKVFDQIKHVIPHLSSQPKVHVLNQLAAMYGSGRKDLPREYAAIVVDEVQDFGASEFRFFAAYTGNSVDHPIPYSLFLAGDGHQRIYGRSGSFKACGIDVKNRSIKLTKCYRSTRKIREYAERLIAGVNVNDPDGEVESFRNGESLVEGTAPEEFFECYGDFDIMNRRIVKTIRNWMERDSKTLGDYAVLLRNAQRFGNEYFYLEKTKKALSSLMLPCEIITGTEEAYSSDCVKIMTMHRAKGLQFQGVVINLNGWPYTPIDIGPDGKARESDDQERLRAAIDQEKCLLYMAIMRAVSKVLLTSTGRRPKELPPKN